MLIFAYIAMKVFLMHDILMHIKVGKMGELQCNHFTKHTKTQKNIRSYTVY